jgi:hypothetical protein
VVLTAVDDSGLGLEWRRTMPFVLAVIIRVVLFLAGLVPVLRWVLRRAREAGEIPPDRDEGRHVEAARGGATPSPPWFYGRPIHERAQPPRN